MLDSYLGHLNEVQKRAVITTEGPVVVIAGAGAGKTRVLTYRIVHLLRTNQATAFQILALTFTNKAAEEVYHRISHIMGNEVKTLWVGTFHSIFSKILRIEAEKIGYPRDFSIYDTHDSKSLVKTIIAEMNLNDTVYKPSVVLGRISNAKNKLITADDYMLNVIYQNDDQHMRMPKLGEIYLRYATRCFKAGAMDFDDLLLYTYKLLHQHEDVCKKYQERFFYTLIDEFQDTNKAQYDIIKILTALHKNICVVGDDAQSIYAFRGADIQNILNFKKDYPTAVIIKLEQNYRSTQRIIHIANTIISHNTKQLQKAVWTANEVGEDVGFIRAISEIEEAKLVSASIFEKKINKKLNFKNFAILYRTNSQSRVIEENLRKNNIPYRIIGGTSFYQRKETKDLIAYLRFIVNHNDEESFKRIINFPKRGIGMATIQKILESTYSNAISLWEVLCNINNFMGKGGVSSRITSFVSMIQEATATLKDRDAYESALDIAKKSGLLKLFYEDNTIEGRGKYENVQELLNGIKEFTVIDSENKQQDRSLGNFLQTISLITNADQINGSEEEGVTLMTIHAAKGLEFHYVYIIGMEEGLFPSPWMLGSREDLEEERRLFYVAITRAQKKVILSYALSRYRFGTSKQCEISRFIREIPAFSQEGKVRHMKHNSRTKQGMGSSQWDNSNYSVHKEQPIINLYSTSLTENNFQFCDATQLQIGMGVLHMQFGKGKILQVDDTLGSQKIKVDFQNLGEKTLLLRYAKLKIIDPVYISSSSAPT